MPSIPKQGEPGTLSVSYDKTSGVATLSWDEPNGEMNAGMYVQRQPSAGSAWANIAEVQLEEGAAHYVFHDSTAVSGAQYRIRVVDANNKEHTTSAVMAVSTDMTVGDAVEADGKTMYLGGNILANGDFDMGTHTWLDGTGAQLDSTFFQVFTTGGTDGGTFLKAYGNGGQKSNSAIYNVFDIVPNSYYYFSGASACNTGVQQQVRLSDDGTSLGTTAAFLYNTTDTWASKFTIFNSEGNAKAVLTFRLLGAQSQFDKLMLSRLFDTKEAAIADGIAQTKLKAQAFTAFNTKYAALNDELSAAMQAVSGESEADYETCRQAMDNALAAYYAIPKCDSLRKVARMVLPWGMPGESKLWDAVFKYDDAATAADFIAAESSLRQALADYLPLKAMDTNPVKQPDFSGSSSWTTKCGTYTGGDQRTNSKDGVTFWNAWWSGLSASEGKAKTMAIKQEVKGLSHGLYAVRCKATTEHYCLSDQHAYITDGTQTAETPMLTADYYDLTTISNEQRWQTLTSTPIYVEDGGSVTIGFESSKQGATDNLWRPIGNASGKGDMREGWWCATDFELVFCPMYKTTVEPNQWGVICLPYAVKATLNLFLYEIAGISRDYTTIYLRDISESKAGMPFIYRTPSAQATFFEFGDAVKSTKDGPGNLRGFFKTSAKAPTGSYVLHATSWGAPLS